MKQSRATVNVPLHSAAGAIREMRKEVKAARKEVELLVQGLAKAAELLRKIRS